MLMFSLTLLYTGLHQVVWGGLYTTSIGFTEALGEDRKKIAALCGIMFGAGEVLGGILFGFLGNLTVKRGREPVILLGLVLSVISYFLIFINLPFSAPLHSTSELGRQIILSVSLESNSGSLVGYLGQPNSYVAYVTGFLMGFSDACFLTQVSKNRGFAFPSILPCPGLCNTRKCLRRSVICFRDIQILPIPRKWCRLCFHLN